MLQQRKTSLSCPLLRLRVGRRARATTLDYVVAGQMMLEDPDLTIVGLSGLFDISPTSVGNGRIVVRELGADTALRLASEGWSLSALLRKAQGVEEKVIDFPEDACRHCGGEHPSQACRGRGRLVCDACGEPTSSHSWLDHAPDPRPSRRSKDAPVAVGRVREAVPA